MMLPGGRGYSVAILAIGLGTVVIVLAMFVFSGHGESVIDALSGYFLMLGAVGAVYQGQNITQGLPGKREWESTPAPQDHTPREGEEDGV